ncbi:MAG: hypothetical protein OEZ34_12795 [Spirochaetia bacterium]|nr:hypothetical protein [Spirochaetia bacterium]
MRVKLGLNLLICFFAVIFFSSSHLINAQPGNEYTWDDGYRTYKVWIQSEYIMEFDSSPGNSNIKSKDHGAELVSKKGKIRLWKIKKSELRESLSKGKVPPSLKGKGKFSPVFSDSKDGKGLLRALPGGMIIYFQENWSLDQVNQFAESNGLKVLVKMKVIGNAYAFRTNSGLSALLTANQLRAKSGVLAAFPDWWVDVYPR